MLDSLVKFMQTLNTTVILLEVSISCRLNIKNQSDQVSIVTPFLANLDADTFYHVRHLSKNVESSKIMDLAGVFLFYDNSYEPAYFDYRFVKGQPINYSFVSDHRDWNWHQDKGSAVGQPNILVYLGYSNFYANSRE